MSARALAHLSSADPTLGAIIRAVGPSRLVPEVDCEPFQALVRAIAHQQLHGRAANRILARFAESCGDGGFPSAQAVLIATDDTLRAAGFSFSKIAAVKDLAAKTVAGIVPGRQALLALDDAEIIARLTQVRGIGRWTVQMLLIFQLGRPDVLPVDDFGIRNGFRLAYGLRKMPDPRAVAGYGERWGPYRSTAAWYLWRAVELDRAGGLPEPAERIRLPAPRRRRARKRTLAPAAGKAPRHRPRVNGKVGGPSASSARPRRWDARTRAHPRPGRRSPAPGRRR